MAPRLTFLFLGRGQQVTRLGMDSLIAPLVPLRNVVLLKGLVHSKLRFHPFAAQREPNYGFGF